MTARTAIAGYEHVLEPGTSGWTLLLLHGTGGDEHDLVPLGRQLAPDATVLSPRGTVLEGGITNRFFARRGMDDIDVPDMLARTDTLRDFVASAVEAYGLDADRIVAVGYSNGANVALSMLLRHPGMLRGAGLLRPALYDVPEPLPSLAGTDVLLLAGGRDPLIPAQRAVEVRDVLVRAEADVELVVDPVAGHGLVQADLQHLARWTTGLLAPTLP